jgi:hypothetical protein
VDSPKSLWNLPLPALRRVPLARLPPPAVTPSLVTGLHSVHQLDRPRAVRYSQPHPARARQLAQHSLSHAHLSDLHPAARCSQLHPARAQRQAQPMSPASVLPDSLQLASLAVMRSCSLRRLRQARQALHLVASLRTSPSPLPPRAPARRLLLALLSLHLLEVCPRQRSPHRRLLRM